MNAVYPDTPGHRGVDTSVAAAEAVADYLPALQSLVYRTIVAAGADGLTADELAERVGYARWSVQPRTTELKLKGLIVDSGVRRRNSTGKQAIVWVTAGAWVATQLGKYSVSGDGG